MVRRRYGNRGAARPLTGFSCRTLARALPVLALAVVHVALACSASSRPPVETYEKVGAEDETWRSPFVGFLYHAFGWTAFLSWSCSFYPQIWENYRTWSVEGISFDFVSFNFIKHSSYGAYNVVLYFSKAVQSQYEEHYKTKTIPVALNDVGFSIHAVLMVMVQICQLCTHERGQQRITFTATMILAVSCMRVYASEVHMYTPVYNFLDVHVCTTHAHTLAHTDAVVGSSGGLRGESHRG